MLFGILPHISHSSLGATLQSTKFLQVSPRKIENLISGGPSWSVGVENFSKNKSEDTYLGPRSKHCFQTVAFRADRYSSLLICKAPI